MKKLSFVFIILFIFSFFTVKHAQAENLVNPLQVYSYQQMTLDIKELEERYPNLIESKSIGKTPHGRQIWAVKLGKGSATVFFNASHHSREWLTTNLMMEMIDVYASAYQNGTKINHYDVKQILDQTSIWFVPMVNPDGVTLQQSGLSAFPKGLHSSLIAMNGGSSNFKKLKATPQGIDLNRQYPAKWDQIRGNKTWPSWKNHKGNKPFQTVETQAIRDFTYEIDPEITVAYHSAGQILYWHYFNKKELLERDQKLAETFAKKTGYQLVPIQSNPSGGGYKDWFIQEFHRPGFTPEIGEFPGETNLPLSAFPGVWKRNDDIGVWVASEGYKLWKKRNPVKVVQEKKQNNKLTQLLSNYQSIKYSVLKSKEKQKHLYQAKEEIITFVLKQKNYQQAIDIQNDYLSFHFSRGEIIRLAKLYESAGDLTPHVFINQKPSTKAFVDKGITYMSAKDFATHSRYSLKWDGVNRSLTFTKDKNMITLFPNSKTVIQNGRIIHVEIPALVIKEGSTYIPLRTLEEWFDGEMKWIKVGNVFYYKSNLNRSE